MPGHSASSRPSGNSGSHVGGNMGHSGSTASHGNFNGGGHSASIGGNHGGSYGHTAPGRTVSLRGGGSASIRPNGQIRSINRNGMQIHNNLRGGRTIVSEHNGVRVVGTGRSNGYVQRSYITRGGHSYYSRTYYSHGAYHVGVYRGYYYHGYQYYGYRPAYWYNPGFYGWAYRPWGFGLAWGVGFGGWGWAGSPWYGYYGPYFAPYPVYPSAAFWLTDYLISENLQAAYAARADAAAADAVADDAAAAGNNPGPSSGQSVTLTPEVKEAIAEEVKAELAAQQQQAANPDGGDAQAQPAPAANGEVPPALDPARRNFIVDNNLTVVSNGQECALTGGDVITRLTDTPDADNKVTASVSASKSNECAAGAQIVVSVDDLQEMRNHFEEQLNNGMKTLAEKQGTGNMPKAPDTGTTASDIPAPQPDTTAEKQLTDQETAANQTEAEAKQEATSQPNAQ